MFALIYPEKINTDWYASFSASVVAELRRWQIIGVISFTTIVFVNFFGSKKNIKFDISLYVPWVLLCLFCASSTIWSIDPVNTAIYSGVLVVLLLSSSAFWLSPDRMQSWAFLAGAVAISAGIGYLSTVLPTTPRSLGGITANLMGHFGFAVIILAFWSGRAFRLPGLIFGIALISYSQARTVLGATAIFLFIYYLVTPNLKDRKSLAVTSSILGGSIILMALIGPIVITFTARLLSSALGVTDTSRLEGSGFTGRGALWSNALTVLQGHELTGFGFRTRGWTLATVEVNTANGHSGILNALLDLGIIGTMLFIVVYCLSIIKLAIIMVDTRLDRFRVSTAFLISYFLILSVEPNYLNFAHPTSFLMLLALCSPLALPKEPPALSSQFR